MTKVGSGRLTKMKKKKTDFEVYEATVGRVTELAEKHYVAKITSYFVVSEAEADAERAVADKERAEREPAETDEEHKRRFAALGLELSNDCRYPIASVEGYYGVKRDVATEGYDGEQQVDSVMEDQNADRMDTPTMEDQPTDRMNMAVIERSYYVVCAQSLLLGTFEGDMFYLAKKYKPASMLIWTREEQEARLYGRADFENGAGLQGTEKLGNDDTSQGNEAIRDYEKWATFDTFDVVAADAVAWSKIRGLDPARMASEEFHVTAIKELPERLTGWGGCSSMLAAKHYRETRK